MSSDDSHDTEVHRDEHGHARIIDHSLAPVMPMKARGLQKGMQSATDIAHEYLRQAGVKLDVPSDATKSFVAPRGMEVPESDRLHHVGEKNIKNIAVVSYEQGFCGLPVWNSTVTVTINTSAEHVLGASNDMHYDIDLQNANLKNPEYAAERITPFNLAPLLGLSQDTTPKINATRTLIYRFVLEDRFQEHPDDDDEAGEGRPPTLPVPDLEQGRFVSNKHYIVTEVLFTKTVGDWEDMNWRVFLEPESGAVLYIKPFVSSVNAYVFEPDPVSQGCIDRSGVMEQPCVPKSSEKTLDPYRKNVSLLGLDTPVNGNPQELKGEYISLVDLQKPKVAPPTEPVGTDFDYPIATDEFTAVNAYYHCDRVLRRLIDLGFDLETYFPGTRFPIPADFLGESKVNAHCIGNATGDGVGKFTFGIAQKGTKVGIATDMRIVLHEFGHALLWNHVGSPNFGFAHSCGDSLAAILCDPLSAAPDRGRTFPFIFKFTRRHDRPVDSWAWFGKNWDTNYKGEQVLSSTLFRAYRCIGGDSDVLAQKQFASEYMFYLIVKACGLLFSTTPDPRVYASRIVQADRTTETFDGRSGGTASKVLRWSFEQQGLYQAPDTPKPYVAPGLPPNADVYIDDGRHGGYEWTNDWQSSPGIWNRNEADGQVTNETPKVGVSNQLYVEIKNRGIAQANNVTVRCYQGEAPYNWPKDWKPLTTAKLACDNIPSGGSQVSGPFEWTPVSDNSTVLAVASANGDPPIIDNASIPNMSLENWRLVPADNNIAQRNFGVQKSKTK